MYLINTLYRFFTLASLLTCLHGHAKEIPSEDTLNYKFLNGLALKGEIKQILALLDTIHLTRQNDIEFKTAFQKRFKFHSDQSGALDSVPDDIKPLVKYYQMYWRRALLDTTKANHEGFKGQLLQFLKGENAKTVYTQQIFSASNLDSIYKKYIDHKGYFATDFGKTGFLYDLILWKTMKERPYRIELIDDTLHVPVFFIDSFVSLGWIGYARMGRSSAGGWATKEALYCVTNGYDTTSEKFLLSYLKHEAQHFSDYRRFAELPSRDLEYRGKLMELYYGQSELVNILQSFIRGAKYDKTNAHPFANFCVIRNISQILFSKDFETDIQQWQSVSPAAVRQAAKTLYEKHTTLLKNGGFLE